jgi:hypothetical protein
VLGGLVMFAVMVGWAALSWRSRRAARAAT